jgi:hypothetical protein
MTILESNYIAPMNRTIAVAMFTSGTKSQRRTFSLDGEATTEQVTQEATRLYNIWLSLYPS